MMNSEQITIPTSEYARLVTAAHEAEQLKDILRTKNADYCGILREELRMLCVAFDCEDEV